MMRKLVVVEFMLLSVSSIASAQERLPIIDMHLHTGVVPDMRVGLCVPWVTQFPAWDPSRPWSDVWMEAMTEPPCSDPIWSPGSEQAVMEQTIAVVERRNIIGVLSGWPDDVRRWMDAAPGRFIPSLAFKIGRDTLSPQAMRALFENGGFAVLGEITNQYAGIAPDDERMEPYWTLMEELDVPVAIHIGEGTIGTAHMGFEGLTEYRSRLSNPYLLEEVLIRHPRLRLSVMHYAAPLVDEMIAVLAAHPQVYVDIGGMQWYYPRPYFYEQLRKFVDAGFGKRVMFGSDQGDWAGVIEPSIEVIEQAPFLTEEQKRDILYNNAARFLRLSEEEIARHHGRTDPLQRVESLQLRRETVGRVVVFFAPSDSTRARDLAGLADRAASHLGGELDLNIRLQLAALAPDAWFSPYPGVPYAIPWASVPHRLIFMPASLSEGLLVYEESEIEDRRRADFILLHEIGHLLANDYFRPASPEGDLPVPWLEELLATYIGYAHVHATDPEWAAAARREWQREVRSFSPQVLSLDWTFMRALPPEEVARTYGWYQYMLNLRAAELFDDHGLEFLRQLRVALPWSESGHWTTESVLPLLERVAPGFQAWADALPRRAQRRPTSAGAEQHRLGSRASASLEYDVVIRNGRVIDPESGLDAVRNVGIRDGVIRTIARGPSRVAGDRGNGTGRGALIHRRGVGYGSGVCGGYAASSGRMMFMR